MHTKLLPQSACIFLAKDTQNTAECFAKQSVLVRRVKFRNTEVFGF